MRRIGLSTATLVSIMLGASQVLAQEKPRDTATYVLTQAIRQPRDLSKIDVAFGKSFPDCTKSSTPGGKDSSPAAENSSNWVINIESTNRSPLPKNTITPSKAELNLVCEDKLITLTLSSDDASLFDSQTNKIIITYKQGNFPDVRFNRPEEEEERRRKTYTAAKGKDDADIYLFGSATGAHKSKPIYSIDAKLAYYWDLKAAGAIGPQFTFTSDEGSDVDPDSITAKLAYENIFILGPARYLFLNIDAVGGEFDKEGDTKNFISGLRAKYVPRSVFLSENNIAAIDFSFGVEGGRNFKNAVDPDGSGGIFRLNLGAAAHFVALAPGKFKRIFINADYFVRLPQRREIFIEKIGDDDVFTLRKRARHLVAADVDLMFSDAFGITIKYQYGSMPPSFKLMDHKVSAGFTMKLRQNR